MPSERLRHGRSLALWVVLALAACSPTGSSSGSPPGTSAVPTPAQPPSASSITADGLLAHLAALDGIARANGGNRAVGSPGYEASVAYVREVLEKAGWSVTLDTAEAPTFTDRGGSDLRIVGSDATFVEGRDFRILGFSGAGTVEAPLASVELRCADPAMPTFPTGSVVLVRPAGCTGNDWIDRVVDAGAAAVLGVCGEWPRPDFCVPELRRPLMRHLTSVPVAIVGPAAAAELEATVPATVHVTADVESTMRPTTSVVGELAGADPSRVVMVGAHLDGSVDGPGIEDDGSGVAAVLEIARLLAGRRPAATVRVALWSAEEVGLVGSRHYAQGLGTSERSGIEAYLNADVIAARNGIRAVEAPATGDAAAADLTARLTAAFGSLPSEVLDMTGSTDRTSFSEAGIPAAGVVSFALGPKTEEEAATYGGTAGAESDACYHRSCDGLANAEPTRMTELARALAAVAVDLAFGPPGEGHAGSSTGSGLAPVAGTGASPRTP